MARRKSFEEGADTGQYHLPRLQPEDLGLPHEAPEHHDEEPFGTPEQDAYWKGRAEGRQQYESEIEEDRGRQDQTPARQKQLRGQIERADQWEADKAQRQADRKHQQQRQRVARTFSASNLGRLARKASGGKRSWF